MRSITRKRNVHSKTDGFANLTKRTVVRQARFAGRRAALRAMHVMGFVVTIEDGWVIKKYRNGQIERISKIAH